MWNRCELVTVPFHRVQLCSAKSTVFTVGCPPSAPIWDKLACRSGEPEVVRADGFKLEVKSRGRWAWQEAPQRQRLQVVQMKRAEICAMRARMARDGEPCGCGGDPCGRGELGICRLRSRIEAHVGWRQLVTLGILSGEELLIASLLLLGALAYPFQLCRNAAAAASASAAMTVCQRCQSLNSDANKS